MAKRTTDKAVDGRCISDLTEKVLELAGPGVAPPVAAATKTRDRPRRPRDGVQVVDEAGSAESKTGRVRGRAPRARHAKVGLEHLSLQHGPLAFRARGHRNADCLRYVGKAMQRSWFGMDATGTAILDKERYRHAHIFVLVAPGDSVLFRFEPKYGGATINGLFGGYTVEGDLPRKFFWDSECPGKPLEGHFSPGDSTAFFAATLSHLQAETITIAPAEVPFRPSWRLTTPQR